MGKKSSDSTRDIPQSFYQWLGDTGCAKASASSLQDARFLPGSPSKAFLSLPCHSIWPLLQASRPAHPRQPWLTRPLPHGMGVLQRAGTHPGRDLPEEGRAGKSFPSPLLLVSQPGRAAGALGPRRRVWCVLHGPGLLGKAAGPAAQVVPVWRAPQGSAQHTAPAAQAAISRGRGPPPPVAQRLQVESGGRLFHCSAQDQQGLSRQGRDCETVVIHLALKGWDGKERN